MNELGKKIEPGAIAAPAKQKLQRRQSYISAGKREASMTCEEFTAMLAAEPADRNPAEPEGDEPGPERVQW